MFLYRDKEERLVLNDRAADRTTKLVADQVIANRFAVGSSGGSCIREPVIRSQSLNAVVFEQRTVPLVGSALQHGVSDEPASLAELGAEAVSDHAIFFNCFRSDGSIGTTLTASRPANRNSALALLVVVNAFHEEVASAGTRSVDGRAAECSASLLLRHCASY